MVLLFANLLQSYNKVMALDYHKNFVSTQYLEKELMELDQIFQMHCVDKIYVGNVTH